MSVGAHRYWMLADVTSPAGNAANRSMASIKFRDSGGTVYTGVLADSVAATNGGGTGTAAAWVDGDDNTLCRVIGTNVRMVFDLGSAKAVHSIDFVAPSVASAEPLTSIFNRFKLMYSDDNVNFHFAESADLGTWSALGTTKTFTCTSAGGSAIGGMPALSNHRYWRLTNFFNQRNVTTLKIKELKLYQDATQRTISAVSASNGVAANAVDGNSGTVWSPANSNNHTAVTFDIDLGTAQSWNKIEIVDATLSMPSYVDLYYSDDNATWTFVATIRFMSPNVDGDTRSFSFVPGNGDRGYTPISGGPGAWRYWRMNGMIASDGNGTHGLTTLELRDASGVAMPIVGYQVSGGASTAARLFNTNEAEGDWAGAGNDYGAWIIMDLGSPQEVREIYYKARAGGVPHQAPRQWSWEYSNDGINWHIYEHVRVAPCATNSETRQHFIPASMAVGAKAKPGAHRYWQLANIQPQGGWGHDIGMSEIKVYDGATQHSGITFTAKDTFSGTSAANLGDGNNATVWASNTASTEAAPQWIKMDLGSAKVIDKIELVSRTGSVPNQYFQRMKLQYSDDGVTYTDYCELWFSYTPANNEMHDFTFADTTAGTPGTGNDYSYYVSGPLLDALQEAELFFITNEFTVGTSSSGYYLLMKRRKMYNYLTGD